MTTERNSLLWKIDVNKVYRLAVGIVLVSIALSPVGGL